MHSAFRVTRLLARTIAVQTSLGRQQSTVPGAQPAQKYFVGLRYVLGIGAAAWASQQETVVEKARLAYLIPTRLARDVYIAASIVADYKVSLKDVEEPVREQVLHSCHQRSADKLLQLCFKNGGIYIKLGQYIGQLDHLLPVEYVVTMRNHLLNKCPVSDWAEVRAIIQEDLGAPPEQLFRSFNPTPIASASLAQVHKAVGHDGQSLAVKVQHAGLRESCSADVTTIEFLVDAVRYVFPDFNYQWLVDEIKENLPKELDFQHEAANAERCRSNLASSKSRVGSRVHVPGIIHPLSSHRVLTMEYIDGVGVTDKEALSTLGIAPHSLAQVVAETFNEMIFIHGDVHCDPHAANMLVRKVDGRTQLVLLDHGLYRQIDDPFREQYAGLWRSLVFADKDGIKKHSEEMNAGDAYPLFAAMLTHKPWDQITDLHLDHLSLEGTKQEKEFLQKNAQIYASQIGDLLLRMPRPLLLLLKTNDCLRSVDLSLGQPVNTFLITARECTRALADIELERSKGPLSTASAWLNGQLDRAHVELLMWVMTGLSMWARLKGFLGGGQRYSGPAVPQQQQQHEGRNAATLPAELVAAG